MLVKLKLDFANAATRDVLATPLMIEAYGADRVKITVENINQRTQLDINVSFSMLEQAFEDASRKGRAFVDLTPSGVSELKGRYSFSPDF
jgi:hypothetical protein